MRLRSVSVLVRVIVTSAALLGCGKIVIGDTGDGGSVTGTRPGSGTEAGASPFTPVAQPASTPKVDLLFDIDNSASMGDKQAYLIQAIPQMVARLVTPRCFDNGSKLPTGQNASPSDGTCPGGSFPEFTAVHDMHLGVVTSSLGSRLGVGSGPSMVCDPRATLTSQSGTMVSAFNDDQGRLINRTGDGTNPFGSGAALADAHLPEGGGFLYWFPALGNTGATPVTPPTPVTTIGVAGTPNTLVGDFTELVGGAGESGCGIESQLESWYRFLIQPDPYATLVNNNGKAEWSGVDTTVLQQRHDFLRPDSIVAVIVLSDENDSEIDVRSYQGSGYLFMSDTYSPPRATSACVANPNDPGCAICSQGSTDPGCAMNGGVFSSANDANDWGYNLNLRHVHMPQKYGLDPQYPLTRYSNGLTSPTVPNRSGEYPSATSSYVGNNNCTNPLFAAKLPSASDVPDADALTPAEIDNVLCQLPGGAVRKPSDVFYAHIGGVPHQLLQSTPGDGTCPSGTAPADCPQKDVLSKADWVKILGKGPAAYTAASTTISYDYSGIDPHMVEAMTPRNQSSLPYSEPIPAIDPSGTNPVSGTAFGSGADPVRPDPVNGREWITNSGTHSLPVDRQYACIFQLPASEQRDCAALKSSSIEGNSCDCIPGAPGGAVARRPPRVTPPTRSRRSAARPRPTAPASSRACRTTPSRPTPRPTRPSAS